ncbi:MAG: hypothetical protein HYZ44_03850 [Bacteroidetes bacterium]|nr:hypothetical protein [Bacteroidota bacterium]
MKTRLTIITLFIFSTLFAQAQKKADTVVIKVGEASKVIFAIQDKKDLETLKHYNFQSLMDDMIAKLDKRDSTQLATPATNYLKDSTETVSSTEEWPTEADRARYRENNYRSNNYDSDKDYSETYTSRRSNRRRTYSSFNIDIGTNNYLENGKFPGDANKIYTVRPWGSWYVALNSTQRTRLANKFFLEWAGGISWYNFKFQNDKTLLTKDNTGVTFSEDLRTNKFDKSKLTVVYVNLSAVPMIDFAGNNRKSGLFSGNHSRGFRMGAGPYVGYRIDSYTKQVYEQDGDDKVERHHDPYYLNNIRYGIRAQFGFRGTDFFFNYDMNDLFVAGKGPQLNAFSFGITL